jgi:hypothetical protein
MSGTENNLYTQNTFLPTIHYLPLQRATHYQNKIKPPDYMKKDKKNETKKIRKKRRRKKRGANPRLE